MKQLSEILWEQREVILDLREPSWVLKVIWVIPAFSGLALLVTEGNRLITISVIIFDTVFVAYSVFTYSVWKSWKNTKNARKRFTIAVIMIYDGFLLISLSVQSLAIAVFSLQWVNPDWVQWAGLFSAALYLILIGFLLVNGKRIVVYLIEKDEKPLPPPSKLALALPSYLLGAGIALGAIFRTSQIGVIILVGLAFLAAYLLLPFAFAAFYQVFFLVHDW